MQGSQKRPSVQSIYSQTEIEDIKSEDEIECILIGSNYDELDEDYSWVEDSWIQYQKCWHNIILHPDVRIQL